MTPPPPRRPRRRGRAAPLLLAAALALVPSAFLVVVAEAFQKPPTPPPTPPQQPPPASSSSPSSSPAASSSGGGRRPPLPFTSKLLESFSSASSSSGGGGPSYSSSPPGAAWGAPPRASSSSRLASAADTSSSSSSSSTVAAPPGGGETQVTLPGPGPFRLIYDEATDCFAFQTATVRLRQRQAAGGGNATDTDTSGGGGGARVTLAGSVHIAEPGYYKALEADVGDCDVVLYEMITSENNVLRDASDPAWPAKERLGVELAATPELRRMALTHGLEPQLDSMHFFGRRNWFLSDIPRERLCALQRSRGERALDEGGAGGGGGAKARFAHVAEMGQIFWEGFTSRGKVLPKFLTSLKGDLSAAPFRLLRLCMWLTPAPELQLLLLDWARQYPPAGGFSKILRSMVGAVVHGDFLTLRRLAFSQMLTSSQGTPPPEVLVLERNSKVVLDVEQALRSGARDVGVLYGGLHMKDIEEKLVRHLNFTRDGAADSIEWTTAWTMPAYTARKPFLVAGLCVALPFLYLGVGAADWSATFGGIAHDVALSAFTAPSSSDSSAVAEAASSVVTAGAVREAVLYVLRHMYMYYGLTRWVVEWERRLIEMQ